MFQHPLGVEAEARDRCVRPVLGSIPDAIFVAEVMDASAHLGTVKVMSAVSGPVEGIPLAESSGVYGPRRIGAAYPPHTTVLCLRVGEGTGGRVYVLGAIPSLTIDKDLNMNPDWIVSASRSGIGTDRVHWHVPLGSPRGITGEISMAAGSPCDELPGDYGFVNELGVGMVIGRLMSWLRAGHFCGVEAHWLDSLLRLVGHNFEVLLSSAELRILDDEGESSWCGRWGPYPWETLGVMRSDQDFTRGEDGRWGSGLAGREPLFDDQMGIWRVHDLRGYLGDLRRTIVGIPLAAAYSAGAERMSAATVMPGVLETGYRLDGEFRIRSAKGILLEKTVCIPKPKELKDPDDPTGDSPDNYIAAGAYGTGGDPHDKPIVELPGDRPGRRALMAFDRDALEGNLYGNLPLVRHEKDWLLPEENASREALGVPHGLYQPENGESVSPEAFQMPLPAHADVALDHRGSSRYYAGRARVQIADDGSILIEDAFGSQIRMEGGNIILAPRNDVILQPGRNVIAWAPHDAIVRAGNAVDVSASQSDVRIKAQGNLMMTAVDKGVLIESRSQGDAPDWKQLGEDIDSRGVMIRATESNVTMFSRDAYLRTGIAADGSPTTGELHLDSGEGRGEVFIHGRTITQRAAAKSEIIVGSTGENEETASFDMRANSLVIGGKFLGEVNIGAAAIRLGHESFDSAVSVLGHAAFKNTVLCTGSVFIDDQLRVGRSMVLQNNMQMGGNLIVRKAIICNIIAADQGGGFLPSTGDDFQASAQVPPEHPSLAKDAITQDTEQLRSALLNARLEDNLTVAELNEELYGEDSRFASPDLVGNAVFTFRVPKEYGTDGEDFQWHEARWQQYNRLLFGQTQVWNERALISPYTGRETMPHPGFEVWEEREALVRLEPELFDFETGASISRSELKDKTLTPPSLTTFKKGYIVTMQRRPSAAGADE